MTKFEIVEREIIANIDKEVGEKASQALAALAVEKRDEVIAKDKPSSTTVYVDGVEGASLSSVKPDGVIRFEFGYMDQIVRQILAMLVDKSPYGEKLPKSVPQTHYRDEHAVFINGLEMTELPDKIPDNAEVVLSNLQPYARKVEQGFGPKKLSAHGVYQGVARLAKSRFGNQVKITYTWREFPGNGPKGPRARKGGRATRADDDNFPSIVIEPL